VEEKDKPQTNGTDNDLSSNTYEQNTPAKKKGRPSRASDDKEEIKVSVKTTEKSRVSISVSKSKGAEKSTAKSSKKRKAEDEKPLNGRSSRKTKKNN